MFFCIRSMRKRVKVLDKREGTKGQATIEAAALIPVLFYSSSFAFTAFNSSV